MPTCGLFGAQLDMTLQRLKLEFFYLRKAAFQYRALGRYVYNRWVLSKKILRRSTPLEKSITAPQLSMHVLTCHRDIIMTLWALGSFYARCSQIGRLFIHNDGTLTAADIAVLKKFFPSATIDDTRTFPQRYAQQLSAYPDWQRIREENAHAFSIKKIIDPQFVSSAPLRLILDTDILWLQQPIELEHAIAAGCPNALMQRDPGQLQLTFKDGEKFPDEFASYNAGIILYAQRNFNRQRFSDFLRRLDRSRGRGLHFLDQAGYAYSLENLQALPSERYAVREKLSGNVAAKHYTSPRRPLFYIEGLPQLQAILLSNSNAI